jgi:hypothetical protein
MPSKTITDVPEHIFSPGFKSRNGFVVKNLDQTNTVYLSFAGSLNVSHQLGPNKGYPLEPGQDLSPMGSDSQSINLSAVCAPGETAELYFSVF